MRLIRWIKEFIQCCSYENGNSYNSAKVYLVFMFSLLGFLFTFVLGLVNLFGENSNPFLTNFLLIGSPLLLVNLYFLKVTQNIALASMVVLYLYFALMVYLVYSGGIEKSGPLWIYTLAPVALYLHGLRKGLIDILLFLGIISFLMFYPDNMLLQAEYTTGYKIRIILSFIILTLLATFYEYSRTKLYMGMIDLNERIEHISKRDHLTALYNRRGYESRKGEMSSDSGVILMSDIDHFKAINDTYGHEIGDRVIYDVAKRIKANVREDDVVVRWGGEEFFIYLTHVNIDDAYNIAEKIRKSVEKMHIQYNGYNPIHVTISIGLAAINENSTLEQTIKNADSAMYLAKQAGRNKTLTY